MKQFAAGLQKLGLQQHDKVGMLCYFRGIRAAINLNRQIAPNICLSMLHAEAFGMLLLPFILKQGMA